jgi:hypothetical protein
MPVVVDRGGIALPTQEWTTPEDPYYRVDDILSIRTAHPPSRIDKNVPVVQERPQPETDDDCMVLHAPQIQQYRIEGEPSWASHAEILSAFQKMWEREKGNGLRPYYAEEVFAPVKIVFAEASQVAEPIRAALAWGPVYPWQSKLATLKPEQPLWRAYASVAVLNSRYGLAWYRRLLRERPPRSERPHGLKVNALKRVPIAKRGYNPDVLERVVEMAHQLSTLFEARQECLPQFHGIIHAFRGLSEHAEAHYAERFSEQIRGVERRLQPYLCRLLGLEDEAEEEALLIELKPTEAGPFGQDYLFSEVDLLPKPVPGPAVILFSDEEESWMRQLLQQSSGATSELRALKLLRYWHGVVNSPPPAELLAGDHAEIPSQ